MRFRTTILQAGKTATGIHVPDEVVEALGAGKRPPVRVTLNGHTYRSTVAVMGGRYMVGVSAEVRAASGVNGGDTLDVELELDEQPRVLAIPQDLQAALNADPAAKAAFEKLSHSNKRRHVDPLAAAKAPETRARRVAKSIAELKG
jgi:hypothetical protein